MNLVVWKDVITRVKIEGKDYHSIDMALADMQLKVQRAASQKIRNKRFGVDITAYHTTHSPVAWRPNSGDS